MKSGERRELGRVGLGLRLRELRLGAGFSLAELAERSRVSLSYVSDLERGRRVPSLELLDDLCLALDTSVVTVLVGVYPWDTSVSPTSVSPPPDARRRPRP